MGKFGLGRRNEAGQRLIEFCQENALVIANNIREDSTHGHQQTGNIKIRLIIFFAAKDGEALYSHQKHTSYLCPYIHFSLPLCNNKEFDLGHT